MKFFLLWLLICATINAQSLASLEGKVLNNITGDGLSKVTILLAQAAGNVGGPAIEYVTETGTEGNFSLVNLPPGQYRMYATRNGFVRTEYGARGRNRRGAILILAAEQKVRNIEVKMQPQAVISGRVLDSDGEPLSGVQMTASRYRYQSGRRVLVGSGNATTNDMGEYRIFGLEPARYYISATYRPAISRSARDHSGNPKRDEIYLTTYFPGTTELERASSVEARSTSATLGIDIYLSRTPTVTVSGQIINQTGLQAPQGISAMLLATGSSGNIVETGGPQNAQGNFEFRKVSPGSYYIVAMMSAGGKTYSGRTNVDVGTSNVNNTSVTIGLGYELTGSIKSDGAQTGYKGMGITLRPTQLSNTFMGTPSGTINDDGTFKLTVIDPGTYLVSVQPLKPGSFVKSIKTGERDLPDFMLDLSRTPSAPLTINLAANAPEISGLVTNAEGKPVVGATVVLIPDQEKRRNFAQWYKFAPTDQLGHYNIKGIDPGKYKLLAWEDIDQDAWMDPDLIRPLEDKAKTITFKEGAREAVNLNIIPPE